MPGPELGGPTGGSDGGGDTVSALPEEVFEEEERDTVSALPDSESADTVIYTGSAEQFDAASTIPDSDAGQGFAPEDAPSSASTRAPGDPAPREPHGHPAPRPGRELHGRARNSDDPDYWAPCNCPCRDTLRSHGWLGPREPLGRRCACPMCGHRSIDEGHGCHFRVSARRHMRGSVLCGHCEPFCLRVLRWADRHYEANRRIY